MIEMMTKSNLFKKIVRNFIDGTATSQQAQFLEEYFNIFSAAPDILEDLNNAELEHIKLRMRRRIDRKIALFETPPLKINWRLYSAAAVFVLISFMIYFYRQPTRHPQENKAKAIQNNLIAGGNAATLTLSDGSRIDLAKNSAQEIQEFSSVIKNNLQDGRLTYAKSNLSNTVLKFNTISTPRGGQYQLILADGTKVWLNAQSTLRYPVDFKGTERLVELTGEGYFEVAKKNGMPFKIKTSSQSLEVLGTHFNVYAYQDEPITKTTLLEGSLKVSINNSHIVIRPGEQTTVFKGADESNFHLKNVDVEESVAWKNGYFVFTDEPLESILIKVGRWYDAKIEYKDSKIGKERFSGTLTRSANIASLLDKFELTGSVHFDIDDKLILVKK